MARVGTLLIASDYDGTLAPIVDNPDLAHPDAAAMRAIVELGAIPDTAVALISGRSWAELHRLSGAPPNVALIGGHGAEFGPASQSPGEPEARAALVAATASLQAIAAEFAGAVVEPKPTGVAFHYRKVDPERVAAALSMISDGPARDPRLISRHGKMVVELSSSTVDKGIALARLERESGADATVFIGDDVTDEDAFAALSASGLGIKVGPGPTNARHRLASQDRVAGVLRRLLGYRREKTARR